LTGTLCGRIAHHALCHGADGNAAGVSRGGGRSREGIALRMITPMLKNLLLTGLRNLWRQKIYTLIDLLGLATGIACFVLIGLYVKYERGFDRFVPNADR